MRIKDALAIFRRRQEFLRQRMRFLPDGNESKTRDGQEIRALELGAQSLEMAFSYGVAQFSDLGPRFAHQHRTEEEEVDLDVKVVKPTRTAVWKCSHCGRETPTYPDHGPFKKAFEGGQTRKMFCPGRCFNNRQHTPLIKGDPIPQEQSSAEDSRKASG